MSGCGGSCSCCGGGCAPEGDYQVWSGVDTVPSFEVMGVSAKISGAEAVEEINALWEDFFEEQVAAKIGLAEDDMIFAVYSDYEGDHTKPFRLTIGFKVPEDADKEFPEEFHRVKVREETYALMSCGGEQPKSMMDGWKAVWESDLDRRFATDFEVYGPRFFQEGVHEVLVAVGVNISEDD